MSCVCLNGGSCPLELELLEDVEAARAQWENFGNPGAEAAVDSAERRLYEHRKHVQHLLCGRLVHAQQELRGAKKEIPVMEARKKLEAIGELYREAKRRTSEVAPWTRAERLNVGDMR